MATVGTLKFDEKTGTYTGMLKTLTITLPITIERVKAKRENGPDFVIMSKGVEIGSGWVKVGQRSGKEYVSCSFSAPEFGKPFFANIGRAADGESDDFVLIFNPPTNGA